MTELANSLQDKSSIPFQNLVLADKGLGLGQVAALQLLDKNNSLDNVQNITGTAGGAFIATLWAVGYSPQEIVSIFSKFKFKQFKGKPREFTEFVDQLIYQKIKIKHATFADLSHKQLYIPVSNLSSNLEVLSQENSPQVSLAEAVTLSMSFNEGFDPLPFDKESGLFNNGKGKKGRYRGGDCDEQIPCFYF